MFLLTKLFKTCVEMCAFSEAHCAYHDLFELLCLALTTLRRFLNMQYFLVLIFSSQFHLCCAYYPECQHHPILWITAGSARSCKQLLSKSLWGIVVKENKECADIIWSGASLFLKIVEMTNKHQHTEIIHGKYAFFLSFLELENKWIPLWNMKLELTSAQLGINSLQSLC